MDDQTARLAEQLKRNPNMLRSLMQSRDGQSLIRMLNSQGTGLQQAAKSAAKGDTAQLAEMVNRLMHSPEGAALAERIQKSVQGG